MANVAILTLVLLLMGGAFLLGRHLRRRHEYADDLSPVTRQHIDLFQGGQLNETAVETAKNRIRRLLERGDMDAVEAGLRPGMHYVIQVRALAEIGTDAAGRILERQLQRRLTDDQIEQSWYWIDLANGLRSLNRQESLPHLLRCAEAAGDIPLSQFFAAETVCFLGFTGYLRQVEHPLGLAALRVLHRALEGLRSGVPPVIVPEARLGEMIEQLWDHRPEKVQPVVVRVFVETLRLVRRAPHAEAILAEETGDHEAFQWQLSRLAALEPVLEDYLREAAPLLCQALTAAPWSEHLDYLSALDDLRQEAATALVPLLARPGYPHAEQAVRVLTWSKDPRVGPWLRDWAVRHVPVARRAMQRRRANPPRRRSISRDIPYAAILGALRGHPSPETETFLLLAARDWDPTIRATAIGSLGWWEPLQAAEVKLGLQEARWEVNGDVRAAARAALARLGERRSLQWYRQAMTSEDPQRVHEAVQTVASEGLTLLWPDLDRLADADDPDIAFHAREVLERLCEELPDRQR